MTRCSRNRYIYLYVADVIIFLYFMTHQTTSLIMSMVDNNVKPDDGYYDEWFFPLHISTTQKQ